MKKVILTIACVITLVANAKADNYQPISYAQLPKQAQTFISTYFPSAQTSLVRRELDVLDLSYNVIFTDGSKVEFDRQGNWTEVDCLTRAIPAGIVPAAIVKVIEAQYPQAQPTHIDRDRRDIEVKLNNRVELTFNKKHQLIDID